MTTTTALYNRIVSALGLESRTIVFHIVNDGPMAGGMIPDLERLENSDAFLELADDDSGSEYIQVWDCVSFMLGSGESDAATAEDLELLQAARDTTPRLFRDMLSDYADIPAEIDDIRIQNPYYEEPDDDTGDM